MLTYCLEFFKKYIKNINIPNPPYEYNLMMNIHECEYPWYLKKLYKVMTGENLNLNHPKTLNEKIQWLKLFDKQQQKSELTDKVKVRNWVRDKIGEQYLKPALWIGNKFDEIPFETLPVSFIIKCNHGCKWNVKIKNKEKFLAHENLYKYIKMRFDNWLQQSFFGWSAFEIQYKDIEPKIIIEPLLYSEGEKAPIDLEIYCFNGKPVFFRQIRYTNPPFGTVYDENFNNINIFAEPNMVYTDAEPNNNLKSAVELSKVLSNGFKLVRVDWISFNNNLYFNEMTFTPQSGFFMFNNKKFYKMLSKRLKIK